MEGSRCEFHTNTMPIVKLRSVSLGANTVYPTPGLDVAGAGRQASAYHLRDHWVVWCIHGACVIAVLLM